MFDALSSSLQKVFRNLRGYGKLSDDNVKDALRDVRLALLEADVNFQVARDFIASVRAQCVGEEVLGSITPGQQVIKRVHDELVKLLGGAHRELDMAGRPATVMLVGLHGSGKTTTTAKLAAHWQKAGRNVLVVAADIRRPAAVQQLTVLAGQVGAGIVTPAAGETVPALGARALEQARREARDLLIVDTGGRWQLDEELVAEIRDLRDAVQPRNVVLVVDAAIGQESVNVASTFHTQVGLTGLILTKLDGDARGGAALSIQAVTKCPILYVGSGERTPDLEPFYPDRMASRILGMGDVVTLVEKAQQMVDAQKVVEVEKRIRMDALNLEDFLEQIQQMKKMGPLENLLEMLPGGANVAARIKGAKGDAAGDIAGFTRKSEAIIRSMTPRERRNPDVLNASRRRRIATGSGTQVQDVNDLLRQFDQARKFAKQFKRMQKRLHGMR